MASLLASPSEALALPSERLLIALAGDGYALTTTVYRASGGAPLQLASREQSKGRVDLETALFTSGFSDADPTRKYSVLRLWHDERDDNYPNGSLLLNYALYWTPGQPATLRLGSTMKLLPPNRAVNLRDVAEVEVHGDSLVFTGKVGEEDVQHVVTIPSSDRIKLEIGPYRSCIKTMPLYPRVCLEYGQAKRVYELER